MDAVARAWILPRVDREVAKRERHGLVVRLLWDVANDVVVIIYSDDWSGDAFVAEVPPAEALRAFEHPNAYRAYALPSAA
jgi:hypothetical protein